MVAIDRIANTIAREIVDHDTRSMAFIDSLIGAIHQIPGRERIGSNTGVTPYGACLCTNKKFSGPRLTKGKMRHGETKCEFCVGADTA